MDWLVVLRIDLQEVVEYDEKHGEGAEEDGKLVEVVVGDHDEEGIMEGFCVGICGQAPGPFWCLEVMVQVDSG